MSLKSTDSAILFGLSILLSIVLRGNPLAVGIFFLPLSVPLSHSFATHHRRSRHLAAGKSTTGKSRLFLQP